MKYVEEMVNKKILFLEMKDYDEDDIMADTGCKLRAIFDPK